MWLEKRQQDCGLGLIVEGKFSGNELRGPADDNLGKGVFIASARFRIFEVFEPEESMNLVFVVVGMNLDVKVPFI